MTPNNQITMSRNHKRQERVLPPPLFANQRSNLSALASSMGVFSSDTLNVRRRIEHADDSKHKEEAREFLDRQHERITRVEEDLLKATEDILPMDSTRMTMTELVQVCFSLQRANVELMKRLDDRLCLDYAGYRSVLTKERCKACMVDEPSPSPPSVELSTPWQPLVGTSLEQVVETDNETDGTTTPGSSTFFSPPMTLSAQKQTSTPVTPSLDNLHLSSNTAAVLQETPHQDNDANLSKRHSLDAIESWRARKHSISSLLDIGLDETSRLEPKVEARPSIADPDLDNNSFDADTESLKATDNVTATVQAESIQSPQDDDSSDKDKEDESRCSQSTHSHAREERATDSSTIVGAGDLTFADDDTAVATVATVLGRGRKRNVIQKIVEEDSVSMKDESLRVSFDVGSNHLAETGEQAAPLTTMERKGSRAAVERPSDEITVKSSAPVKPTDTTIVGCSETFVDDETMTNADVTVVGRARLVRNQAATALSPSAPDASNNRETDISVSTSPGEHTVKEIIVDTSASSYSMDDGDSTTIVSVLDSTIASPRSFVKEVEDETTLGSLLVTPVLDRYRLEADDTSIGVKVVPNARGAHKGVPPNQKQKNLLTKYGAAPQPRLRISKQSTSNAGKEDAVSKSPYVTQRSRQVYRKTPHPKKASAASFSTADENKPPNMDVGTLLNPTRLDPGTKTQGDSLRSPFSNKISLPELTHRPYRQSLPSATARQLPFSATKAQPERRHTITFKQQSSMSRTPLTAAWIAKHMPEESLDVSGDGSFSFFSSD